MHKDNPLISSVNPAAQAAQLDRYGSGSYLASDVTVLLDSVDKHAVADVPVGQKEALIQSGQRHYSDMLTLEQAPSDTHQQLYNQALMQGGERMANDIANLSNTLCHLFADKVNAQNPLLLVSLVRAGLPIGVLLQRALADTESNYALPSKHYGISIIRDRGLDSVAMQQILTRHPHSPVIFVDGWTGKGAIYGELARSLAAYQSPTHLHHDNIFHQGFYQSGSARVNLGIIPLLTLADPAGVAWLSATNEDWLIPSGLLGSTVSGLISRTLYSEYTETTSYSDNDAKNWQQGLHRSVLYHDLMAHDCSLDFIEVIDNTRKNLQNSAKILPTYGKPRHTTQPLIKQIAKQYQINNDNRIKPTIAEATRAILRRDPERVLLATANHPDTVLLRHLCSQRGIHMEVIG